MWEMRYQYWANDGIRWTRWFPISEKTERVPWQLKNKLKNEYRYVSR